MNHWYGVDLDGTLAEYHGWQGPAHIGKPIPRMLERVKRHLAAGDTVKILTARASPESTTIEDYLVFDGACTRWCLEHLGRPLEVTSEKDFAMVALYDDRAIQIEFNTGIRVDGNLAADISFPIAQDDIIPTWVLINNEIRRLESSIHKLKMLRDRVKDECRHPEKTWRLEYEDRDHWVCDTCNAWLAGEAPEDE